MNYYVLCLTLLVSTTWMLRMLDHQHYHSLTVQALVAQTKREYLLQGIEEYARAYKVHHTTPWQHKVTYQAGTVVQLDCQEESIMVALFHDNKVYERIISV